MYFTITKGKKSRSLSYTLSLYSKLWHKLHLVAKWTPFKDETHQRQVFVCGCEHTKKGQFLEYSSTAHASVF